MRTPKSNLLVILIVGIAFALTACSAPPAATTAPAATAPAVNQTSAIVPSTSTPSATSAQPITGQKVTFTRGDLTLVGYLFKPQGDGPFPAIIWNHGSEQNPDQGPE